MHIQSYRCIRLACFLEPRTAGEKLFSPTLFSQLVLAARFFRGNGSFHLLSKKIIAQVIASRKAAMFLEKVLQQFTLALGVHGRFFIYKVARFGITVPLLL